MPAFFATTPKSLEDLLAQELEDLGVSNLKRTIAGVHFTASWQVAYRALMWSRLAGRILFPLVEFPVKNAADLYDGVRTLPWREHLSADQTLFIKATLAKSFLNHSRYAAQTVKDGVADYFRENFGKRPSVDRDRPDLLLNLVIKNNRAILSVDLGGKSLHRRDYRPEPGPAPLKENLAAAILIRAKWPAIAAAGGGLVDPLCGSGTLVIEAAMIAADIAPGLSRKEVVPTGWHGFDPQLWKKIRGEALARRQSALSGNLPPVAGFDGDPAAIRRAGTHARSAGVAGYARFQKRILQDWRPVPSAGGASGLVVTNPPYGHRIGNPDQLDRIYTALGELLKSRFQGWKASVFTGAPEMGKCMGLRAQRLYRFFNGTLPCVLLNFSICPENEMGGHSMIREH